MEILAGLFYVMVITAGIVSSRDSFDAPIPDQCATFEKATQENKEECDAWKAEHRAKWAVSAAVSDMQGEQNTKKN